MLRKLNELVGFAYSMEYYTIHNITSLESGTTPNNARHNERDTRFHKGDIWK